MENSCMRFGETPLGVYVEHKPPNARLPHQLGGTVSGPSTFAGLLDSVTASELKLDAQTNPRSDFAPSSVSAQISLAFQILIWAQEIAAIR